jgi:hypothetical protein
MRAVLAAQILHDDPIAVDGDACVLTGDPR